MIIVKYRMSIQTITLHNLPSQPTPFVGREADIVDIIGRLRDPKIRLLTLIGTGGIGKTRLAIEVIHYLIKSDFEHGIFFVPLAPLTSADNILTTIINVLGIMVGNESSLQDELIKFLQQRHLLLVMDNVEHVLDGVDLIADILNATANVKILATSRVMLNLSMEHLWHVRGMDYPKHNDPEDINRYDALNLFIERAIQVQRDFAPGDEQVNIIRICQLVDGLPLGIELAAGWLKTLSLNDVIQHIEEGIDILSTRNRDIKPRHRSIHAVFDHSWQLLTVDEQAVFPRLSVFRGGFTLEAAEQVADADLMILSSLIEKSMIRRDANGRYDIHELLRQYGEAKLTEVEEFTITHKNHLIYFASFVSNRVADLKGAQQVESVAAIRADFDNIFEAWQTVREYQMYAPLGQMLEGLLIYFEIIRYPPIASEMYRSMLTHLSNFNDPSFKRLHHRIQIFYWYIQFRQRKILYHGQFSDNLHHSLRLAEDEQDWLLVLLCQIIIKLSSRNVRQLPNTDYLLEIGRRLDHYYYGWVLNQLCYYFTIVLNDNSKMTENVLNEYLRVTQSIHDIDGIATAYSHLAQHARFWGDIDDALRYYKLAINGFRKTNNVQAIAVFSALSIFMKLKSGEFEDVIQRIPYHFEQLNQFGFFGNHRYINMVVTKATILLGDHRQASMLINHSSTLQDDNRSRTIFHIHEAQIMYSITIGDYVAVRQYIMQALQIDTAVIAIRLQLDFLPLAAFLYHHDQQFTEAVKLLGLVFTHPLATTEWMERWDLLMQLCQALEDALGTSAFQSTWEQGAQLDVDTVIDGIRRYVGIESSDQPLSQPLIDPLTNREQDVLHLLGEGYTNSQIADKLMIAIGTVKSHVHKICQKFAVTNRTQAVLEAKRLGLLRK